MLLAFAPLTFEMQEDFQKWTQPKHTQRRRDSDFPRPQQYTLHAILGNVNSALVLLHVQHFKMRGKKHFLPICCTCRLHFYILKNICVFLKYICIKPILNMFSTYLELLIVPQYNSCANRRTIDNNTTVTFSL